MPHPRYPLPLRVYRAAASSNSANGGSGSPLIVLYHGGGFISGSPVTMSSMARALVKAFDAVVVAPAYRLAPEYPFPTGINDGVDTFRWVAANATTRLGADPSQGFIVGGLSVGGHIAIVNAHIARDLGIKPSITGTWLSCASARVKEDDFGKLSKAHRDRYLSRTQDTCVNSKVVTPEFSQLAIDCIKPDPSSRLFAPLIWKGRSGHENLPRTYSQVCGCDTARDELLIYNDLLRIDGVETRLDVYPGLPHCFWQPFKDLPQSEQWELDTLNGFAWLLRREETFGVSEPAPSDSDSNVQQFSAPNAGEPVTSALADLYIDEDAIGVAL